MGGVRILGRILVYDEGRAFQSEGVTSGLLASETIRLNLVYTPARHVIALTARRLLFLRAAVRSAPSARRSSLSGLQSICC